MMMKGLLVAACMGCIGIAVAAPESGAKTETYYLLSEARDVYVTATKNPGTYKIVLKNMAPVFPFYSLQRNRVGAFRFSNLQNKEIHRTVLGTLKMIGDELPSFLVMQTTRAQPGPETSYKNYVLRSHVINFDTEAKSWTFTVQNIGTTNLGKKPALLPGHYYNGVYTFQFNLTEKEAVRFFTTPTEATADTDLEDFSNSIGD